MSGNEEYINFPVLNQVKHRKARHHSMDTKAETGCASISAFCTVCRKDFAVSLGTDANLNYKPSRTQNISWWLAPFLVQVVVAVFPTFSAAFLVGNKGLPTLTALSESECQNTTTTVSGLDKMLEQSLQAWSILTHNSNASQALVALSFFLAQIPDYINPTLCAQYPLLFI